MSSVGWRVSGRRDDIREIVTNLLSLFQKAKVKINSFGLSFWHSILASIRIQNNRVYNEILNQ